MDDPSTSELMSALGRKRAQETVVSLLVEVQQQSPSSLQHDLAAMARMVELALPSLLHFAHRLEERHQQAVHALRGVAVHLIAWVWQRRKLLGPEEHTLLQGIGTRVVLHRSDAL
ncbi:MAG: hypothetical protein NVSMB49_27220 [Ktedonobacteraceae bacterium]